MAIESTFQFADSYPNPLANTYSNPHIGAYVYAYPLSNPNSYRCLYTYPFSNVYRNRN